MFCFVLGLFCFVFAPQKHENKQKETLLNRQGMEAEANTKKPKKNGKTDMEVQVDSQQKETESTTNN